jgi:hypothetical protein
MYDLGSVGDIMLACKSFLMLAALALPVLTAGPVTADSIVVGGLEDHPGNNLFEGSGDYNDLIFSMVGSISVVAPSSGQFALNVGDVNESGSVFWDNNSYDGSDTNFGYCALTGGTCIAGHSSSVPFNYVATAGGGAPVSELFQATGAITIMLLAEETSNYNVNTLGWYDPTNPTVLHQIFAGTDSAGAVVTFIPTGTFALYSSNGVGQFYSSMASDDVNESTTQQHFALVEGVLPEPGTGELAGVILAAAWVGRSLRSRIRRKLPRH